MAPTALRPEPGERFLGAPALYFCDLSHDGRPRLVLAQLAEIVQPPYHGLGLVARTQLQAGELACMDDIGRHLLARPFDYLQGECHRVRGATAPGTAIAALSASHHTALSIGPPRALARPRTLADVRGPITAANVLKALADLLEGHGSLAQPVAVETFCDTAPTPSAKVPPGAAPTTPS